MGSPPLTSNSDTKRSGEAVPRDGGTAPRAGSLTLIMNASVSVISTLSPTLTSCRFFLSSTLKLTVRPSSVRTVTDGPFASMAFSVTVAVSCCAIVPPGFGPWPRVTEGPVCAGGPLAWPGLRIA